MTSRKPDADEIRNFLVSLEEQSWLRRTERRWWPKFIFHYTDLNNAAKILREGYLYCRKHLEETDRLPVDSGSPSVLAATAEPVKEYVRLYFRPQTPTQYHVEGIRSRTHISRLGGHCPTPVFFLFDSAELLTRANCRFSDGTLASPSASVLSTADDLRKLPWAQIYHTGPFDRTRQADIVFRRNAEIIIPERLDLDGLRYIYCRSVAEKETFLCLLPPQLQERFGRQVTASTRSMLFFRQHTFVESASLSTAEIYLRFSPETDSPGPFELSIEMEDHTQNRRYRIERELSDVRDNFRLRLRRRVSEYTIWVKLDNHLAYANTYEDVQIPF